MVHAGNHWAKDEGNKGLTPCTAAMSQRAAEEDCHRGDCAAGVKATTVATNISKTPPRTKPNTAPNRRSGQVSGVDDTTHLTILANKVQASSVTTKAKTSAAE